MPSIKFNNKSIFYTIDQNDASHAKITALLIHGLGSSSCFYKSITSTLKAKFRCIAFDTPGSGLSELGSEQSIETIAKDAIGLLDALKIQEKIIVVGHSMGGIVASQIAAQYPERVKGVVLLGPVEPSPKLTEVFEERIEVVKKDGLETLANKIPAGATGSKSQPLQHAFIRALILGTSPGGYISLCNCIAKATKPDYASIKVPLLLLAGEEDKTAPLSGSEAIVEAYGTEKSEKKIKVLNGVGHWHCVEAPEEVSRDILAFAINLEALDANHVV